MSMVGAQGLGEMCASSCLRDRVQLIFPARRTVEEFRIANAVNAGRKRLLPWGREDCGEDLAGSAVAVP